MSVSSPLGGLIGNAPMVRSRALAANVQTQLERSRPMGWSRKDGDELVVRSLQNPEINEASQIRRRRAFPYAEFPDNSPKNLLVVGNPLVTEVEAESDPWSFMEGLIGSVEGPEDWAAEHDHYLYGSPRRYER